jgi:hypothetical protein
MYTHLALGFCQHGRIHQRFKALMERLAKERVVCPPAEEPS